MISSRPIVAGEDYTADDINNLRNDLLDPTSGHKHNGVEGPKIPFSNLDVAGVSGSTPPTGGSKSYLDLANHAASTNGVHGISPYAHVAGSRDASTFIQTGTNDTQNHAKWVQFDIPFDAGSTPVVVATLYWESGANISGPFITTRTSAGFQFNIETERNEEISFGWIAIGVRST